jgi:hypothetical protein
MTMRLPAGPRDATAPRLLAAGVAILLLLAAPGGLARRGAQAAGQASPPAAATLLGAWSGQWQADSGNARGQVEAIITRGAADDVVVGQFTFLHGARSLTARREGTLGDGAVRFDLLGGGELVLRPSGINEIAGGFTGAQAALPVASGTLRLVRAG